MTSLLRTVSYRLRDARSGLLMLAVCAGVLVLAFVLGQRPSRLLLGLLVTALGATLLLARPAGAVFALTVTALVPRLEFGTGTEVNVNLVTLLIPIFAILWFLDMVLQRSIRVTRTRANLPLVLFLGAGLVSLLVGRATWDPMVPVKDNFIVVQLAQWAIFAFSALSFWLTANLARDEMTLRRLTGLFLLLAGSVAILRMVPGASTPINRMITLAFTRAPLWVLLGALAGGQLLFNRDLSRAWRIFLSATLLAALYFAFVQTTDADSNWVGLGTVMGLLLWLRFPRLRWPLVVLVVILIAMGQLFPAIYEFAGGDQEWAYSGGSRLALSERVIEVTMRNPITGLGPAAYRAYATMKPLKYGGAYWLAPEVNSHNNYVDLYSQTGLVGLMLFFLFMIEVARLAYRLRKRYREGFAAGYVNGMLAAWVSIMVIMLMLDWFLPFVYNIGFVGFQASALVWMFLGGLVALENMGQEKGMARKKGGMETR